MCACELFKEKSKSFILLDGNRFMNDISTFHLKNTMHFGIEILLYPFESCDYIYIYAHTHTWKVGCDFNHITTIQIPCVLKIPAYQSNKKMLYFSKL